MMCQDCNKRPATLHFTKIVNGDKTEFHVCEACARERGEMIPGTNGFSIHHLLSGLLDFDPPAAGNGHKSGHGLRCESCGMTYAQFSKSGRFGCSDCYRHFAERLDPLFRRIHGHTAHVGKVPKRTGGVLRYKRELENLKRELQWRVEREEFEAAAKLRDQIRELERKLNASSGN